MVELLLSKGALPTVAASHGWAAGLTPLHMAVRYQLPLREEIIQLLLARGAEINAQDHAGRTPLHFVAQSGCQELANCLLANNAAVDMKDQDGATPLQLALRADKVELSEILRQQGGNEALPS